MKKYARKWAKSYKANQEKDKESNANNIRPVVTFFKNLEKKMADVKTK